MKRAKSYSLSVAAAAIALASCVPEPRGSCQRDADCGSPAAGLFCAEGVCQAAPRAAFVQVPRGTLGRNQTAVVRVRVDRAHGGAAAATGSLRINGSSIAGSRDVDGAIRFDVPLSLAQAGIEAPVPIEVHVSDDLGHVTVLSESLQLDDLAPRVFIDADGVPTNAVVRGTVVRMRAHVTDGSSVTLTPSSGLTAALQIDGSYLLSFDTAALDPGATTAQPILTATDVAGNRGSASAQFSVTRMRWQVTPSPVPSVGIALGAASVFVTKAGTDQLIIDRTTGVLAHTATLTAPALGNVATNGSDIITARTDAVISSFNANGTVRWNCDQFGAVNAGPALGAINVSGTPVLSAFVLGGSAGSQFDQRIFMLRDDLALTAVASPPASCSSTNAARASNQLTGVVFDQGATSIGTDDNVYAGAVEALVQAHFDGFSWTVQPATTLAIRVTGQAALMRSSTGAQIAVVASTDGRVDAIAYPGGRLAGFPVQASTTSSSASPPTIAEDGTITVASADGRVTAIGSNGNFRWQVTAGANATTPPTHGAGGILYVGTSTGITALRMQDGATLWTFTTRAPVKTPPALGCDGVLYFGDDSGAVTALQTDSTGLADSPWPRGGHDVHGTSNARHPLRTGEGFCAE
ncbi:MAG TPA: PQQ-binding-like beta-propeller repeat protein [Myxococcales bacterium]|nr:PQQ-binding-like beta-propeller repeat protein [Myxococcales bacterium]